MIAHSGHEMEQIPIVKARAILPRLSERLAAEDRAVAVTRHGKPVLAVMPWNLFESIVETMEIMGDPDTMAALRRGIKDIQAGNPRPHRAGQGRLGPVS